MTKWTCTARLLGVLGQVLVLALFVLTGTGCGAHCLVEGSTVDTPSGPRAVETLEVGTVVVTLDGMGHESIGRIQAITVHHASEHREIVLDDGARLSVTAEHPIASGTSFRKAGELRVGDIVRSRHGDVRIVSIVERQGAVNVFDLDAAPTHVFFASGILVHNKIQIQGASAASLARVWVGESNFGTYRIHLAEGGGGFAALSDDSERIVLNLVRWSVTADSILTIDFTPIDPAASFPRRAQGYANVGSRLELELKGGGVTQQLRLRDASFASATEDVLRKRLDEQEAKPR